MLFGDQQLEQRIRNEQTTPRSGSNEEREVPSLSKVCRSRWLEAMCSGLGGEEVIDEERERVTMPGRTSSEHTGLMRVVRMMMMMKMKTMVVRMMVTMAKMAKMVMMIDDDWR